VLALDAKHADAPSDGVAPGASEAFQQQYVDGQVGRTRTNKRAAKRTPM
jgi:hypothetical protein